MMLNQAKFIQNWKIEIKKIFCDQQFPEDAKVANSIIDVTFVNLLIVKMKIKISFKSLILLQISYATFGLHINNRTLPNEHLGKVVKNQ